MVEINAILDELTFNAVENSGGSASVTASVKDSGGLTSLEQATLNLVVTDNSPPEPGGDLATKPGGSATGKVNEGATSSVTFEISSSKMINEDGPSPTQIRILNVEGGTFNGIEIGGDSQPISLSPVLTGSEITSFKKDLTFVAGSDQTEDATFDYVVVDPVTNANSKVSTATIAINPVNDAPTLSGSETARVFNENDEALVLDKCFDKRY